MTDIQSWGEYIDVAILMATYKVLDDDGAYYGEIPGLQGSGPTPIHSGNAGRNSAKYWRVG